MNERILELEKLATETVKCGLNGSYTTARFSSRKFAELIIRECLEIVEKLPAGYRDYRSQIEDEFRGDCLNTIREHFGIEE